MAARRRRLRNLLLDRRYQLHFTLIMVIIAGLLTTGLGTFWYAEMRRASKILEVKALGTLSDDEAKQVEQDLAANDHKRLALLVGFGVLLAFLLSAYGIIMTHKVAGPLYKMTRHLNDIKDGRLHELWNIRKGDQLHEFWHTFRDMHNQLRENAIDEAAVLAGVIASAEKVAAEYPDATSTLSVHIEKLRQLQQRKEQSVTPSESTERGA